ncbi:MAG TPA: hypothetical protein VLX91_11385 [Candidatus Acidoferrales bacterium]|nr:hypothetical protein [Candidatus Acidoferrales bacterium]
METSQNRRHFFDLKIPLGYLLGFYGILLLLYGIFGPADIYRKSLYLNINLFWGILMIIVSGAFLLSVYLRKKNQPEQINNGN